MGIFMPTDIKWANVIERVFWTALETFISVVSIEAWLDLGVEALEAGAIAAGAAAISVIKNVAAKRLTEVRSGINS